VAALVLTTPVFSPQYLVWPIPALVLLAGDRRTWPALGLLAAAAVVGAVEYPPLHDEVIQFQPAGRALLVARSLLLLAAVAAIVRALRQVGDGQPAR
jgi:hypothetical protein